MLTLHHLENSQSIRILWLFEERGAPYEMVMYDRDRPSLLAPAAFKKISPLGTAPVVTDGSLTLAETNAIVDYVLDKHGDGGLRPAPGAPERARYLFWFHAAQGSLQPLLTMNFVFNVLKTRAPALARPLAKMLLGPLEKAFLKPRLAALFAVLEKDLSSSTWLAGETFTAADIVMGYCLDMSVGRKIVGADQYPQTVAYLKRLQARPAYQRAMAKDGKFDPNFA